MDSLTKTLYILIITLCIICIIQFCSNKNMKENIKKNENLINCIKSCIDK